MFIFLMPTLLTQLIMLKVHLIFVVEIRAMEVTRTAFFFYALYDCCDV